jgi:hypothetical protein
MNASPLNGEERFLVAPLARDDNEKRRSSGEWLVLSD